MKTTSKDLTMKFGTMFIASFLFASLCVPLNGKAQSGAMTLQSQAVTQQQKVVTGDGAASDAFGYNLAISGITAVVGAPLADVNGNADQGKAFVYTLAGGIWVQQAELFAADDNVSAQFGYAVAIDGDTIVVGARRTNADKGAVYVFVRSGANWVQQAKLVGNDSVASDRVGESVAISGETIVTGAPLHDAFGPSSENKGSVYIFTRSNATWTQQAKLTASNPQPFDFFGKSVAIDGDTVLIGIPRSNAPQILGSVAVFTRSGNVWSQQAELIPHDRAINDILGSSVAIEGDTAIVPASGARINGNAFQGAVYVFTRFGVNWTQQAKLIADDGLPSAFFGSSVALKNEALVIGALEDKRGDHQLVGSAYLFTRTGTLWSEQTKYVADDGGTNDFLGTSVGMDGDAILVGAPQKQVNLFNTPDTQQHGAVYSFSKSAADIDVPKIQIVHIQGRQLIVNGTDFESPTEIYIDGQKQKKTANDETNPTTVIIARKAGRFITPGQTVTVQVRNSQTGKTSSEFLFTRPIN